MKKILQKTTLALAVAAASASAVAGDLDYTVGATGKVVLANEVFGTGSEDTLVAVPDVTFIVDVADSALLGGEVATIKLTLDSGAVFGEDLSALDKWEDAGVTLVFSTGGATTLVVGGVGAGNTTGLGAVAGASGIASIAVTQGGAIGDNTVTFELTNNDAANLVDVQASSFKVKNLTAALERGVASPAVRLGAEFRNIDQDATDTDTALVILSSQDGVELDSTTITDYDDAVVGLRARIDVADTELSFTGELVGNTGTGSSQDFDETDNVDYVYLGDLQVVRSTYVDALAATVNVKKEDANDFDFNGSDVIDVVVTSTSSLANYSSVYLRSTGACDATVIGTDYVGTAVVGDPNSVNVSLSGDTTIELETGYNVCAVAGGVGTIPESSMLASLDVSYFNPRYTDSADTLSYGPILRNGCQVTLFNVPNPSSGDKAFIRLSNVSEKPGAVRAFMWTQDGTQIDLNSELVGTLDAHATVALNTNPGQAGYLGDNMPTFDAQTSGRNRLVVQGAFPACEALGLVRTPSGVLTNMTSTTYSGDATRLGPQNNGTSNTSN